MARVLAEPPWSLLPMCDAPDAEQQWEEQKKKPVCEFDAACSRIMMEEHRRLPDATAAANFKAMCAALAAAGKHSEGMYI